jgi:hypothetical protein
MKRDIVVSKLMYDESIAVDKYLANTFSDKVLSSIYMGLSAEARKVLLDGYNNSNDVELDNEFHKIIGFQQEEFDKSTPITNEIILNLCNNFIRLEDCNFNIIFSEF